MKIYIIRHGQSRGNIDYSLRDAEPFHPEVAEYEQKDPSLTRLGVYQADRAGQWLSQIDFDTILCGPLHRHIGTAYGVVKHQKRNKEIEILSDLTEVGTEGTRGLLPEFYESFFPGMKIIPCTDPSPAGSPLVVPKEWECAEKFRHRGRLITEYIKNRFPDDATILIVSSAMFGGCIVIPALLELTDDDIDNGKEYNMLNTAISMVEITRDGRKTVRFTNDVSHLTLPADEDITKFPIPYADR